MKYSGSDSIILDGPRPNSIIDNILYAFPWTNQTSFFIFIVH